MDRARRVPLAVTVMGVLAALSIASCGGDTERLTATELAAQGNIVCAQSDKKLQKAFEEELAGEQPTPEQMQAVLERVVPITEETVSGLRKLEPPEKLEDEFDEALAEATKAIKVLEKGAASPKAAEALFSAPEDPFTKTNKGLEAVGITTCSQGGDSADGTGTP